MQYLDQLSKRIHRKYGSLYICAEALGINHSQLSRILATRIWISPEVAVLLESKGLGRARKVLRAQVDEQLTRAYSAQAENVAPIPSTDNSKEAHA